MIWGTVISTLGGLAKDYFKGKVEEQKIKQEVKLEKLRTDADWEARMADASANSFKDEWFTILLSLPIIFVGYGVAMDDMEVIERVHRAFEVLHGLPEWFQYLLYTAVLASFGIKGVDKIFKR
jgi:hypothetical protein